MICSDIEAVRNDPATVVVVGSGPAGLVAALELRRRGVDVTVLESGLDRFDAGIQAMSDAELLDPERHASMQIATRRALGGTSLLWGGRCVAFDDIDFKARRYVLDSGWPFGHDEVRPWYGVALRYLDAGDAAFSRPLPTSCRLTELRADLLERWSGTPNLRRLHAKTLSRDARLRIHLGATVVGMDVQPETGRVVGVQVATASRETWTMRPRAVVLACGGLETTRLLLVARSRFPQLFGGEAGPLGRYYMGHLSGKIADILFVDGAVDAAMDFFVDECSRYVRRRITVDERVQERHRLLNMAAFPDNPPLHDPSHRSAILSLAYLSLTAPFLGPLLAPEVIRMAYSPCAANFPAHLRNIVMGMPEAAIGASRFLYRRYLANPRLPGFFVRNSARRYALHYHGEQSPNPSSTVSLADTRDALGVPRLKIDSRLRESDARSVVASHEVIDRDLRRTGIGELVFRVPAAERAATVLALASDGFHQLGTTRMAQESRRGVVDGDCRVHGTPNLFVASSSVFPTSGQANPTLLLAALSARLAAHLASTLLHLPEAAPR